MARLPASLQKISLFLQRLPGIGEKSANRLAFFLMRLPDNDLSEFAEAVSKLKSHTKRCIVCLNLCEDSDVCEICRDTKRDTQIITVVESVLDILSFEAGNIYNGIYHVLHGKIDPLNRVSASDLTIDKLSARIKNGGVSEVILATNPDMEGEATAVFISREIARLSADSGITVKVSRLAYGLPMGGNLEYADYVTLKKAIDGRSTI
jgi:recombination protein RecR